MNANVLPEAAAAAAADAAAAQAGTTTNDSSGAGAAAGDQASKGKSLEELTADINRETEERIRKLRDDAQRRIAAAAKSSIPLPARKTTAFEFMESARDRLRALRGDVMITDAAADQQLKQILDAWFLENGEKPAAAPEASGSAGQA